MILATVFIIDDEGDDLVLEAFLHHDQPAESTVAVFKGMDAFEPDMEVQNVSQLHFFLASYSLISAPSSLEIWSGGRPYL